MTLRLAAAIAALFTTSALHALGPPAGSDYIDLSQAFVAFYDASDGEDIETRVAAFKREVAPQYPGFYAPREGRSQDKVDANIRRAIEQFASIRDRYEAVQREFPAALDKARLHFQQFFPHSSASLPTYLVHSLGEMDGGTRTIDDREVMIFGADGIALYHSPEDIGPFFDHEFLHIEQSGYLGDCEPIWCSLWTEGLATAAAAKMNPGIGYQALMLETPKPIPPVVDMHWREALCLVSSLENATADDRYKSLFYGNGGTETFPPRWGYYVGYKLAARLLESHELVVLAHMPAEEAEGLVKGELAAMAKEAGGCPD